MIWIAADSRQWEKLVRSLPRPINLRSTSYLIGFYFCKFAGEGTVFGFADKFKLLGVIGRHDHEVVLK